KNIYIFCCLSTRLFEQFGRDVTTQAGSLCYFSLGFRQPGGAARSRAYCIIGVPPVFPIRAKGNSQKPKSQTRAPEPFEDGAVIPQTPQHEAADAYFDNNRSSSAKP